MKTKASILLILIHINISAQIAGNGVTDIDGNYYTSVFIGGQEWMSQNLNVSRYRNGDIIPQVTSQSEWENATYGAWCYYMNNINNEVIYGKLYNWYAINDSRGLAPVGWHIPTYSFLSSTPTDFSILINSLGGDNIAGGKMKATTNEWLPPNTGATNSSGFSALPGGIRATIFFSLGEEGYWWTLTPEGITTSRRLAHDTNGTNFNNPNKFYGLSVRAINDIQTLSTYSLGNDAFKIFPNPTRGTVNIQFHNFEGQFYSIEIYNLLGQLLFNESVNKELYSFQFSDSNAAGIYLVKIYDSSNNLIQSQKIVLH